MEDFEKELKAGFLEEAAQLLADAEQCFLDLEKNSNDSSGIEKIFRLAHNLKGSAGAVGFAEVASFTHRLESFILKIKNKEKVVDTDVVNLLLRSNDHLRAMVETLQGDMSASFDSSALMQDLLDSIEGRATSTVATTPEPELLPEVQTEVFASEPPIPSANNPNFEDTSASEMAELMAALEAMKTPSEAPLKVELVAPAKSTTSETHPAHTDLAPAQSKTASPAPTTGIGTPPAEHRPTNSPAAVTDESIRVSLSKLDLLLNNVGEMVILQTVLQEQRSQFASPLIQRTIGQLSKISKNIQEVSMSLRMVPLKTTFQKMQRIVRDTSKLLNKDVELNIQGEETELDKTVLEHVGDPLVHLIRNAVDHGLESTEERIALGKSAKGIVTLKAFHRGQKLIIEVRDDGKGLDAQKLKRKAVEKGLIPANREMSDAEAHQLIFHPGFSTKAEVTDISGRGVGLDVVKTNIRNLEGEVQIETQIGQGTCFRILLPLTLAIIDGLLISAGGERYVIPLAQMHESLRPLEKDIQGVSGMGDLFTLRGESLPLLRLTNLLGRKSTKIPPITEGIAMVVRTGDDPFAVWVDDILGQQQVVIKQLGREMPNLKGITGSAILGDGRAALILDLPELAKLGAANISRPAANISIVQKGAA